MTLYKAKKITAKGDDEGNYQKTGSALDTVETDGDGLYVFSDIAPGNYIVVAAAGSNYEAVRPRGGSLELGKGGKETDVVNMAFGEAARPSTATPTPVPTAPQWDAANSTFATGNSPNSVSFALLYTNGRLSGEVTDSSAARMHGEAVIDLRRCLTIDEDANDDGTADDPASICTTYDGWKALSVDVSSNGSWSVDDLREGYYEAEIDPPGGYQSVDNTGAVVATNGGGNGNTYWVRQTAELTSLRPRVETANTFYIAKLGANTGTTLSTLTVDGTDCTTGSPCETLTFDVGSADVIATLDAASAGGVVELWDNTPGATGSKKLATLESGDKTAVSFPRGTTALQTRIFSEQGYQAPAVATQGSVHRNYDTRLESILVEWEGGSHSVSRADLEAMDNFLTDEAAGTRDIGATTPTAPTRNPAIAIELPTGVDATEVLTLTCTAKSPTADATATPAVPGVTVTCASVTLAASAGSGTATIADSSVNTRNYSITFTVAN